MKQIITMIICAGLLFSCKKENDAPPQQSTAPITLVRDPRQPDNVIGGTQSQKLMQAHLLRVTKDSFRISSIQTVFSIQNGLFTTGILDSLYITISDSARGTLSFNGGALIKTPVSANSTFNFNPHLFLSKGTYVVRVYASVRSAAPQTIETQLSVTYWQGLLTSPVTVSAAGQTTTVTMNNVITDVSSSTPERTKVSGGQKIQTLVFTARSFGSSATLTTVKVQVTDGTLVQFAEVYEGTILVGNASFTGNSVDVPTSVLLPENVTKTFSVKLQIKPVLVGQSRKNVKTSVSIKYQTESGEQRSNDTLRTGNDCIVYKAVPIITLESVNRTITNNSRMNIFVVKVTAPSQGDISIAQFRFPVGFADLGVDSVQMFLQPMLHIDNINMTATARFMNQAGDTISSSGFYPETTTAFVINEKTSAGEYVVPAGITKRFFFSFIPRGFNPAEFDAFNGTLGSDPVTNFSYLNLGTSGWDLKLFSLSGQHAGAIRCSLLWSDRNALNHNTSPLFSSGDWDNGEGVYTPQPTTVFQK